MMDSTVLHASPSGLSHSWLTVVALIVAALMARGTSEIYEPHYIDRGYEHIEDKLRSLGAEIRRESAL